MNSMRIKGIIKAAIPIMIALISFFVIAQAAESPKFHKKTISSLDEKKTTVMELAAASTAASAAITMIPGDAATPLADELAELSSYFLIVLSAIYLEKYLITITGFLTFKILIPAACVLTLLNRVYKSSACRALIQKLIIIGVVIVCVIPASEYVSGLIAQTYDTSIEAALESAKTSVEITEDEEGGIAAIWNKVKDGVTDTTETVKNTLNNFIEALAIMIVTSCVIPVVVLLFFIWFIKFMVGININLPNKEELMVVKKGIKKLRTKKEKEQLEEI